MADVETDLTYHTLGGCINKAITINMDPTLHIALYILHPRPSLHFNKMDTRIRSANKALAAGQKVDADMARGAMQEIMSGTASPPEVAAFLVDFASHLHPPCPHCSLNRPRVLT